MSTAAPAPGQDSRSLPAAYWERLWAGGRRYRQVCTAEKQLMAEHLGPGKGRPALDIGSGVRHEVARIEWIRLWRSAYAGIMIPG